MIRVPGWALVLAAIAGGCYRPTFTDCQMACVAGTDCPNGLACSDGFCTHGTRCVGADGGAPDGGGPDAEMDGDADSSAGGPMDLQADTGARSDTGTDLGSEADRRADAAELDSPELLDANFVPDVLEAGAGDDAGDRPDAPFDVPSDAPYEGDAPSSTDGPGGDGLRDGDGVEVPSDGGPAAGGDAHLPWTPGSIPNLVLWLEGDRGIDVAPGAKVWDWRDQSGHGNDARQRNDTYVPTLAANAINGLPAVAFTFNTWMLIPDDLSLRWGFGDFVLFVLFRSTSPCLAPDCLVQALYRKQENGEPWPGPGLGIQPEGRLELHISSPPFPGQHLVTPQTGYDSGRAHLLGGRRRADWPSLRIDGIEYPGPPPSVVVNLDAVDQDVYFGAHGVQQPPSEYSFSGYIGAMIGIKGSISDADVARIENYLMTKYGVEAGEAP